MSPPPSGRPGHEINGAAGFNPETRGTLSAVGAWSAAASLGLVGLAAALLSAAPQGPALAAAFPPWWPPARIFAAAGAEGDVAGTGALRSIVIVTSARADLAGRLRAAGAILILAATGPFGCRIDPPSTRHP